MYISDTLLLVCYEAQHILYAKLYLRLEIIGPSDESYLFYNDVIANL